MVKYLTGGENAMAEFLTGDKLDEENPHGYVFRHVNMPADAASNKVDLSKEPPA